MCHGVFCTSNAMNSLILKRSAGTFWRTIWLQEILFWRGIRVSGITGVQWEFWWYMMSLPRQGGPEFEILHIVFAAFVCKSDATVMSRLYVELFQPNLAALSCHQESFQNIARWNEQISTHAEKDRFKRLYGNGKVRSNWLWYPHLQDVQRVLVGNKAGGSVESSETTEMTWQSRFKADAEDIVVSIGRGQALAEKPASQTATSHKEYHFYCKKAFWLVFTRWFDFVSNATATIKVTPHMEMWPC